MQCIIIKGNVIIPNSAKVQLNEDSLCYLNQTLNLLGPQGLVILVTLVTLKGIASSLVGIPVANTTECNITPKNRRFLAGQTPVSIICDSS